MDPMREIVVPEGMLKSVYYSEGYELELRREREPDIERIVEATLRWLSENPIVPTVEQSSEMMEKFPVNTTRNVCVEWQRRMFLSPESEVPESIKDLIFNLKFTANPEVANNAILEAYRRGQRSVAKGSGQKAREHL